MSIPKELVAEISRGNCVVFVGAGLSQGSGLPGWGQLLKSMLTWGDDQHLLRTDPKELEGYIASGEFLLVADELREQFGKTNFHRFMLEIFSTKKSAPTSVHRLLPKIPFSAALTSNYDTLVETAYTLVEGHAPRVFTYEEYPELSMALRSDEFYILKVHGTIDRIDTIILGTRDYREVMNNNAAYRQHLSALFSTRTILFLGFGLSDPDLIMLLNDLRATFRDFTGNHFALADAITFPEIKRRRFEVDYGIRIIPYLPSEKHHPEVEKFLQGLIQQVTSARQKIDLSAASELTPLHELANEVRTWLQAIRYTVEDPRQIDDHTMGMMASLEEGIVSQKVLVHCIGGEISVDDVLRIRESIRIDVPQGILISDKRISPPALELAAKESAVKIFNLSGFLQQMIWGSYFDLLKAEVTRSRILDLYVDIGCYKELVTEGSHELGKAEFPSLESYMDSWLTERGKMHISLLGEFGTGKTWFCRHYAYRQLERYIQDPANERLPLLITLRSFTKASTAQQLINDALLEVYKLPVVGSAYEMFQEMNRRGKLLLILDGFDEMARQVDYQTMVDNFWELAELVQENSKVILTSRTEYFRRAEESKKILAGEEYGRRTKELRPPKFEVLNLEPFSDTQIRSVIVKRLGPDHGNEVADKILDNPNLAEMARKPVLVELLLAALDEVSADVLDNQAQVYLYATNKLLMRNITAEKTFTSTADKLFFLCELAWEMINSGELRIHYVAIPERIKTYFGDRIKDQHELDTWDFDLRNQTLLHRDVSGYYEFAHKSLAEFFVAFKFAAELGCIAHAFAQAYREAGNQPSPIPFNIRSVPELKQSFGVRTLNHQQMYAVRDLLQGMLAENCEKTLWETIKQTKGKTVEEVGFVGGNAAILLNLREASFAKRNLSETVLSGTELNRANLRFVNLQRADLRSAGLFECDLTNADLREANLSNTTFSVTNLTNSNLVNCNCESSRMISTKLTDADMRGANLSKIYLPDPLVLDLEWAADGDVLITAGNDGSVGIWNARTWKLTKMLQAQTSGWTMIAVNAKTKLLAVVANETEILLWDLNELEKAPQRLKAKMSTINGVYFSSSGKYLSTTHGSLGGITIWDCSSGKILNEFEAQPGWCNAAYFLADERTIVSTGYGGSIRVWEWEKKQLQRQFDIEGAGNLFDLSFNRSENRIAAVAWYLDKEGQISAQGKKTVFVWSFPSFDPLLEWRLSDKNMSSVSLALCPEAEMVAVGAKLFESGIVAESGVVMVRRVSTDEDPRLVLNDTHPIRCIGFDPKSSTLAIGVGQKTIIADPFKATVSASNQLKVLDHALSCQGMRISGALGLDEKPNWAGLERRRTLKEYLLKRGAILGPARKPAKKRSEGHKPTKKRKTS